MVHQGLVQGDSLFRIESVEPGHRSLLTDVRHRFEVSRFITVHSTICQRRLQSALVRRHPFLLNADATLGEIVLPDGECVSSIDREVLDTQIQGRIG